MSEQRLVLGKVRADHLAGQQGHLLRYRSPDRLIKIAVVTDRFGDRHLQFLDTDGSWDSCQFKEATDE